MSVRASPPVVMPPMCAVGSMITTEPPIRRICTAAVTPAMVAPYTQRSAAIGVTAMADDVAVSSRAATEPAAAAIRSRSRRCSPGFSVSRRAMDPLVGRLPVRTSISPAGRLDPIDA